MLRFSCVVSGFKRPAGTLSGDFLWPVEVSTAEQIRREEYSAYGKRAGLSVIIERAKTNSTGVH